MNENIKNLVSKVKTDTSGKWINITEVEALAELIVRECAKVSATKAGVYDKDAFVAKRIKEHFGVEL